MVNKTGNILPSKHGGYQTRPMSIIGVRENHLEIDVEKFVS
jgi:hypothetical protein